MARRTNNEKWPEAARLLAQGWTATKVCIELGVNLNSVSRWRKNPHFVDMCKAAMVGKKRELKGLVTKDPEKLADETEWSRLIKDSEILKLKLRPPQQRIVDAFDGGAKIAIFGGGNGAGKTLLALREALETCWGMKKWAPKLATVKIIGRRPRAVVGQQNQRPLHQHYVQERLDPELRDERAGRTGPPGPTL
jgi:predicted ribonuclease YlaK